MHILPSLEVGGMENGVINIANNIDRNVFSVSICCIERLGQMRERLRKDISVFCLNQKPGKSFVLPFKISALLKSERIDIVHTHNNYSGFYGLAGAILAGIPTKVHGEHGVNITNNLVQHVIERLIGKFTHLTINVSEDISQILITKYSFPLDKVKTIINGVDTRRFHKKDKRDESTCKMRELHLDERSFVLGTVGRLCEFKNHKLLIKAMRILAKRNDDVVLILVGNGPLYSPLTAAAQDLIDKKKVVFAGVRTDIEDIYQCFDLLILPSNEGEGTSNVILEAMAVGVPVIASNTLGNRKIVRHKFNGLLFEPDDVKDLKEKIIEVLSDEKLRDILSQNAWRTVYEHHGLEAMVREYENEYLRLYQSRRTDNGLL